MQLYLDLKWVLYLSNYKQNTQFFCFFYNSTFIFFQVDMNYLSIFFTCNTLLYVKSLYKYYVSLKIIIIIFFCYKEQGPCQALNFTCMKLTSINSFVILQIRIHIVQAIQDKSEEHRAYISHVIRFYEIDEMLLQFCMKIAGVIIYH